MYVPCRCNINILILACLHFISTSQDTRPVRASVAGDIVSSVDSSQLNNDSVSPNHPYRGMPNIPGLIIPDRWKSDNPPLTKVRITFRKFYIHDGRWEEIAVICTGKVNFNYVQPQNCESLSEFTYQCI